MVKLLYNSDESNPSNLINPRCRPWSGVWSTIPDHEFSQSLAPTFTFSNLFVQPAHVLFAHRLRFAPYKTASLLNYT
jgi:hypothetical protein